MKDKSYITVEQTEDLNAVGRSYYLYCLQTAGNAIAQARMLVKGDVIEEDHELDRIEMLIHQAYQAA